MLRSRKGKCIGKVTYTSAAKAKKAAFYYKVKGANQDKGQHPYYCKQCKGWHLTSRRSIYGNDLS